jgi:hypothetical protein
MYFLEMVDGFVGVVTLTAFHPQLSLKWWYYSGELSSKRQRRKKINRPTYQIHITNTNNDETHV